MDKAYQHMTVEVPEIESRLVEVSLLDEKPVQKIEQALRQDNVALVKGAGIEQVDDMMLELAEIFDLRDQLELQAGLATLKGHRSKLSKWFMTTNQRKQFQCLPPHCEGNSFTNIQLAAFYCYENTTDGGETILLNVDNESPLWSGLKERVQRGVVSGQPLSAGEIARVKMQYNLKLPEDALREGEEILEERDTDLPNLKIVEVLTSPTKTYSTILEQERHVFWSSIENTDADSAIEYENLLRDKGLFKDSEAGFSLATPWTRVWSSSMTYPELFKSALTHKLTEGDFIVLNNQSWAHAVNNWSPESGVRKTAVALA